MEQIVNNLITELKRGTSTLLNSAHKAVITFFVVSTNILVILNYLYRFYIGRKTAYTLASSILTEFFSTIFMVVILLLPDLILPKNYELLSKIFNTNLANVLNIANMIIFLLIFIILLTTTVTYFNRWLKNMKHQSHKTIFKISISIKIKDHLK